MAHPKIIIPGEDCDPSTPIALDSAKKNHIDNGQLDEISSFELHQISKLNTGRSIVRSNSNPRYNCHGLTFASRRTCISDLDAVRQALAEDGYAEVENEKVLPGDIAVYYDEDGDPTHSGVVVESPEKASLWIAKIFSKLGKGPEVIHLANDSPYEHRYLRYYRIQS